MKLSIVLPAHDEEQSLPELLRRLRAVLDSLNEWSWEIVAVDDGSNDDTWAYIREVAEQDPRIRGLRMSRNFGHQIALSAGMAAAEGDAVITMDSDLQHPPELIPALLERAAEGYDVVYAVRSRIDAETRFKVGTAHVFYSLINRLTSLDLPHGGADFRYMSRRVVDALVAMPERHRFLRGMARWVGYTQAVVEYDRPARSAGRSKYSLRHMVHFGLDAVVGFSALPLRIASLMGFGVSLLGGIYFLYVLGVRLLTDTAVPGWTSVAIAVLLLGGAQLACLGIIGQYLGRMYEEMKGRPLYLLREDTRKAEAVHEDAVWTARVGEHLAKVAGPPA